MNLLDKSVLEFLDEVDSKSPAPGGGSASALVGALGVCLARMYAHLSIGKKNLMSYELAVQMAFVDRHQNLLDKKKRLLECVDKDCKAYDGVIAAYRLPKLGEEAYAIRKQAIHDATIKAIESPYEIMEVCLESLRLCKDMVEYGNKNAISDLACGAIFLDAAVQGAGLNVLINLSSISEEESTYWADKMNAVLKESADIKEDIVRRVKEIL